MVKKNFWKNFGKMDNVLYVCGMEIKNLVTTRFVFKGSSETLGRLMYLFTEYTDGMELETDMTIFNEFGDVMKSRGDDLVYEHTLGYHSYDGPPYTKLVFEFHSNRDEPCLDVIRFMFDYTYPQTKDGTFHALGYYFHDVDGEMGHFRMDKDGMVVVRGKPTMSFNEFKTTSNLWHEDEYMVHGQYVNRVIRRDLYKMGLTDSTCISEFVN